MNDEQDGRHSKNPNYRLTQCPRGRNLVPSPDGGDDLVGICGPGEEFGIKVGLGDEALDGSLEIDNASKDTVLRCDPLAL